MRGRRGDALETPGERWRRRALSIGGYALAFVALLAVLPVLLPLAVLRDLRVDRRFPAVRMLLFALVYLTCELAGLVASGLLWLAGRLGIVASPERHLAWHYALQNAWAGTLFAAARRLFGLRVEVSGDDRAMPGPLLVFVRHASVADTLLPAVVLTARHGLRLRYVLKRELLWDPCLDVVGQRLPNVFVRRGSDQSGREIEAVVALARDLGDDEGILIYPEGTRFTKAKQARRLAEIAAKGDPERTARAARLRHVLPPRGGGPAALLAACPGTDVLVMAHAGFEGLATFRDALRGGAIGRRVRIACWRHPAATIPRDAVAAARWLDDVWARIDAWIEAAPGA